MPTNENFSGVSNCYVFKSQLQEYAQKKGLPTPVYETIKEGPSHEPSFRSTVVVNNVRYDSLPGFFNRKAAEQSAAEVALTELFKAGEVNESISQPVHETGLCKNLLQEYAQKMNYAIPVYKCQKHEAVGRLPHYSCTVEIGGIRYIGAVTKTKKEAEISAARTALLAIQSSASELSDKALGNTQLMVIPCRKRAIETASNPDETVKAPKAKKTKFKKKNLKRKLYGKNADHSQDKSTVNSAISSNDLPKPEWVQTESFTILSSETLGIEVTRDVQDTKVGSGSSERDMPSEDVALALQVADNSKNGQDMPSADVALALQVADNSKNGQDVPSADVALAKNGQDMPSAADVALATQVADKSKNGRDMPSADVALASQVADNSKNGHLTAVNSIHSNQEAPDMENSMVYDDLTDLVKLTYRDEMASMVNDPTLSQA